MPSPAGLAGRPVLLVNDALVVIPALLDHCLVVAGSSEEALAALAGEGTKVEAGSRLLAHSTLLVLQGVDRV